MALVTATTAFLLNREMWSAGDRKEVTPNVAAELLRAGLVVLSDAAETLVAQPQPAKLAPKTKKLTAK